MICPIALFLSVLRIRTYIGNNRDVTDLVIDLLGGHEDYFRTDRFGFGFGHIADCSRAIDHMQNRLEWLNILPQMMVRRFVHAIVCVRLEY